MLSIIFFIFFQNIEPGQLLEKVVLQEPRALRIDDRGRMLIVDSGNHRVIVADHQGKVLFTMGRKGIGPGEFHKPCDTGVTPSGKILVADRGNRRVQLFDEDGVFLNIINISEQSVGSILVTGEERFVLARNNGYGLQISMAANPQDRRLSEFDFEGNRLRRLGEPATHKNPMLRARLNYGPMALVGDTPVIAGSITNELIFLGEQEKKFKFKPGFQPRTPDVQMVKFKNSEGHDNYSMSVEADWICVGLAAIGDDALLMLRATQQSPPRGRPPVSLVSFNLKGQEIKRYPGAWEAGSLAVSPDGKTAWLIVEDDDGWHLTSVNL